MSGVSSSFAEAHIRRVLRIRWWVIVLSALSAAAMIAGVGGLGFSNNYRVFFSPENPQLQAFESLERIYTKNDSILFVVQPPDGSVFTRTNLAMIDRLTDLAWKLPYASRVDSLTNFQHTRAEGDELIVNDLVEDPQRLSPAELEQIRRVALGEPALHHRLIADDGRTTGVAVRLYLPGRARTEVTEATTAARQLAEQMRRDYPGMRLEVTGTAMLSTAFAEAPRDDSHVLFPLMYGVLTLAMWFFLRSVSGVLATFLLVLLSAGGAMGLAGWAGVQLNSASVMAPLIIMTLAMADSVHLMMTTFAEMQHGRSKQEALVECMRINFQPVLLTTLTTVIGFLGLNTSDAPPLRDLGNITAAGVTLAWFYSMTFLPALMAVMPMRVRGDRVSRAMPRLAEWVIRHNRRLLVGSGSVALILSLLVLRLEINDRPVEYFTEQNDFRRATELAVQSLTGFYGFNFSLASGEPGGISDPAYLERVDAFTRWLRAKPEVVHVGSFTDTIKRLNRNLHGDDPAWYRLPTDRESAAQYLLLYEMSLPYGLDLNDQIDVDKSSTRMTIACGDIDFRTLKRLKQEAEDWLRANTPPAMHAEASSPAVMFAFIGERNIRSMTQGTLLSFLIISGVLMLTLRSVKIGALSLVPNVVPIAMAFGIWQLCVGEVDFAVSVVASVSLGIIDDNTVHFLTDYLRGRREEGLGPADAVRYAFSTVGSALWANSLMLVCGFAALAWSSFWPNATLGLLTALVIALAILADFLLVPPLLLWFDREDGDGLELQPLRLARAGATFALLLAALLPAAVLADETAEAKGLRIATEAHRRDEGFGDWSAELRMVLNNRQGEVSERRLHIRGLENTDPADGDRTLIVFDLPPDVKGTALLSHTHIGQPDDQWLYLPSLARVKRISSSNKSGPFMGSEFAYEDFTSQEVARYTYRWLRDEPCGERTCWVIERHPQYANSGYTRQIVWLDQSEWRPQRVEYYDRKDQLLKVLVVSGYQVYQGKHWRAATMRMTNEQTGKATELIWSDYRFHIGLTEADFTETALRRAR